MKKNVEPQPEKKKGKQEKKSESSKGSAAGRNRIKCTRYKLAERRWVNKLRRLLSRYRKFPQDRSCRERIVSIFEAHTIFCRFARPVVAEIQGKYGERGTGIVKYEEA